MTTENNQITTVPAQIQAELPGDFSTVLVAGSIKAGMKALDAGSRDLWQIEPAKLLVIDGFNPRIMNAEYKAHIREIADSIKTEGYFQDQPMAGYVASVDGQPVVYIYSGHTRLAATLIANSEGAEIKRVPVVVSQAGLSMEDMTVALIRGNGGRSLTYYESAVVCKRLTRFGWTEDEIATRTGLSVPLIRNRLSLMAAPAELLQMVANDSMSATLAIELLKNHGVKAVQKAEEAKVVAEKTGKTKILKIAPTPKAKFIKKSTPVMYSIVESIYHDPSFLLLSGEIRVALADFMRSVQKKDNETPITKDSTKG